MASKKILIQVILDDKNVAAKSKQISQSVDGVTKAQEKYFQALQPTNVEIEKYKILTQQAQAATNAKAKAELNAAQATKEGRAQSGLNNAILLETGRLASDASYGFTAIANNLSQVVTLFASFVKTNDGVVDSFKQLGRSLLGTGGFLIAIQLIISFGPQVLEFFNKLIGRSTVLKDTFEDLNSTIGDSAGKFEVYIKTLQDSSKSQQEQQDAIDALNKEFPEYIDNLEKAGVTIEDVKNKTDDAQKINKLQRDEIMRLAMARAAQAKIEEEASKLIQLSIDEELEKREKLLERQKIIDEENAQLNKLEILRQKDLEGTITRSEKRTLTNLEDRYKTQSNIRKNNIAEKDKEIAAIEDSNQKERDEIQKSIDLLLQFTDIPSEVAERKKVEVLDIFRSGLETNELLLMGYTEQQIMAMELLSEGTKQRKDEFTKFGEDYLDQQKKVTAAEKAENKARIAIRQQYFDAASSLTKGLKALGDMDDKFKIAAIITEKAEAIAKVIVKTKESNQVIRAAGRARAMAGDPTAIPKMKKRIILNKISAGVNIAGIVAAAAGGINAIKSKSAMTASAAGGGEGGDTGEVEAPDFNVVGAGGVSQLATTLAGVTRQPLKAFVVSKEITSAQELERNITNNASLD
jgi:hypothetical protein